MEPSLRPIKLQRRRDNVNHVVGALHHEKWRHSLFSSFLLLLENPREVVWISVAEANAPPPLPSLLSPLAAKLAALPRLWHLLLLRPHHHLPLQGGLQGERWSCLLPEGDSKEVMGLTWISFSRSHLWGALNLMMWCVFWISRLL